MEKFILHCDMNNFYASVECMLDKSIKNKPVAVCGNKEERKGIVLSKNDIAKKYKVKTGDTVNEAICKCKNLVIISPPKFNEYEKCSLDAINIYKRYSDDVKEVSIDECFVDITKISKDLDYAKRTADEIREVIKDELGLSISVGLSFNKIFAKIGSDIKKPDATTVITDYNYKEKVWPLPVKDMIGVGIATYKVLERYNIKTIGDLANENEDILYQLLGKHGKALYNLANGREENYFSFFNHNEYIKSLSHGNTIKRDLYNNEEVWEEILNLTKQLSFKLRLYKKRAKGIGISIKNNRLEILEFNKKTDIALQDSYNIAKEAYNLFLNKYKINAPIRSITVRVDKLVNMNEFEKNILLSDDKISKMEKAEFYMEKLNERFKNQNIR